VLRLPRSRVTEAMSRPRPFDQEIGTQPTVFPHMPFSPGKRGRAVRNAALKSAGSDSAQMCDNGHTDKRNERRGFVHRGCRRLEKEATGDARNAKATVDLEGERRDELATRAWRRRCTEVLD
jgi:hypothetical protein